MGNILGWSGNDTDIDDRKQAEEKLRQDEMELRRIRDAIPQAITVLGPEGNALYANPVVPEYTGLTLEDVNGGAFRTQVFLHSHESEHFRNEPKKLRAVVTSRTFVIQTSINQFIFSNLRLEP